MAKANRDRRRQSDYVTDPDPLVLVLQLITALVSSGSLMVSWYYLRRADDREEVRRREAVRTSLFRANRALNVLVFAQRDFSILVSEYNLSNVLLQTGTAPRHLKNRDHPLRGQTFNATLRAAQRAVRDLSDAMGEVSAHIDAEDTNRAAQVVAQIDQFVRNSLADGATYQSFSMDLGHAVGWLQRLLEELSRRYE